MTEAEDKSEKSSQNESGWEKVKYLLDHEEVGKSLTVARKLLMFYKKGGDILETIITLVVAAVLVITLVWLAQIELILHGAFGVMFGTVFGYLLSWRFHQ